MRSNKRDTAVLHRSITVYTPHLGLYWYI